ncbi:MAG: Na+ dependent nucleoside transporter [Verrucomicrobiae bacterium]|nr:Na+ dependent nucleoside transporter [Verrucomicrobiae bacterium]MCP5539954.1 Na+ dependent nucleoside transporter [Akkermansiaceae bacterium]MCP5549887.1 Na+ dependent nucleoside transporter [Akkermansiaceae bacterium]
MFHDIFRGLLGVAVLIGLCWLLSAGRREIAWRVVIGGIALQATLAALILLTPFGGVVDVVSGWFIKLLAFTEEGSGFLFGELLDGKRYGFAFKVLPTIIFVSALTSLLYYLGILQRVVFGFAWVMKRLMRLSGAESLATAANVFVGQTEAPLVVKPYVPSMTRSEIMALMTGGMATIAGSVFGLYIATLGGDDETAKLEVARRLLTASMMNAPAALLVAKMLVPETGKVNEDLLVPRDRQGSNLLDALANGTVEGLRLALNVAAMLLVFVALIALFNAVVGWVGGLGADAETHSAGLLDGWVRSLSGGVFEKLSLESLAGFLFAPLAWVVGADGGDLLRTGQLLGTKMVTNEFLAYAQLGAMQGAGTLGPKTIFLATFALCGFANFSSIGIQLGGIGALAPEQRPTLAALGFKAMIGGTLASLLTASIAGMFFGAVG